MEDFRSHEGIGYDLIHSHYWLSGRLGNWAQELWDRPHVVMLHTLGEMKNRTGRGPAGARTSHRRRKGTRKNLPSYFGPNRPGEKQPGALLWR